MKKTKKGNQKTNNSQKFSVSAIVIVSVLFFAIGFITNTVYANIQASRAKSNAEKFINYLLEGKSDEAYSLTTGEFQETQTEDEFIAITEILISNDPILPVDSMFFISGDQARYEQYVGGLEERASGAGKFNISLEKDGRQWRVQSLNVE